MIRRIVAAGSPTRVLSYFVIQSTALLALVTFASARRAWTARHPLPGAVTGAALLYVVVGALVHHIALADAAPARRRPRSPASTSRQPPKRRSS